MNLARPCYHTVLLILCTWLTPACGGGDEDPTEQRLMAEKLRELVEAEGEAQGGAVSEQELKVWESEITKIKEEQSAEVYETFQKCIMEQSETFAQAEACFFAIYPKEESETVVEKPKTVNDICVVANQWHEDDNPKYTEAICVQDMRRLELAVQDRWPSFSKCALSDGAKNYIAFRGCQTDALPSESELCARIEAVRPSGDEILTPVLGSSCVMRLAGKISSYDSKKNSLSHQIDLTCCIQNAGSPADVKDCLEDINPTCKRPPRK